MASRNATPRSIDAYVDGSSPEVRPILEKIRRTVRTAAPGAQELISYGMPAFTLSGILKNLSRAAARSKRRGARVAE